MDTDKASRWFLGGIVFLVTIATLFFVQHQRTLTYRPEDSPENVVFNYILALQKGDAEKMASLLVQDEKMPDIMDISAALESAHLRMDGYAVEIKNSVVKGTEALVMLRIWENDGPFSSGYSYDDQARLRLENGVWRIASLPYPLWAWEWEGVEP